jgi:beta-glucosidase
VFITADSGEAGNIVEWNDGGNENIRFYDLYDLTHFRLDRNDLNAWHNGNALVQKVASVNKNTVNLCHSPIYLEGSHLCACCRWLSPIQSGLLSWTLGLIM